MTDVLPIARNDAPPHCGREFIGLLSNGIKAVMRSHAVDTEYYGYWDVDGGYTVPKPETICVDARAEFLTIFEWYEMPETSDYAGKVFSVVNLEGRLS